MPRTVYFGFHYQRDIMRVQQVKQHHITKGNYTTAGYFDGSLEEKAKKDGDDAVKRLINNGLNGCSVLCILIGNETFKRRWVDYEILKSVELGMGIFGIRIHQLKDPKLGEDTAGGNPFSYLGYSTNDNKYQPMIKYENTWTNAANLSAINSAPRYLEGQTNPVLGSLLTVYDWVDNKGYENFGKWVEAAAAQAGR